MGIPEKRDGNHMLVIDEKAIQKTHAPDSEKRDVRPLQKLINDILKPSTTTTVEAKKRKIGSSTQMVQGRQVDADHLANSLVKRYKELKENFMGPDSQPKAVLGNNPERCFKNLTEIVPEISIELWYKCSGGGGGGVASKTMVAVFKMLSRYSWEVKIVVTLAAFALIYRDSSPIARNTEPIRYLIDAMVELTNAIVDVNDSRPENISTHIQTAVSWTVESIVACTTHIRYIDDVLPKLTEKVVEMTNSLDQRLDTWHQNRWLATNYPRTSTKKDDENLALLKAFQKKRSRL